MNRLNVQESEDEHVRNIALKAAIHKNKQDSSDESEEELWMGKSNFETVLASEKCVFGKSGLGFYPQNKKNGISKPFSKVPEKQPIERSKQPVVTCF